MIIIEMFRFTQIGLCAETVIQEFDIKKQSSTIKKGDLALLLEISTGMLLFKMLDFQYGINPNDRIIYEDKDPHYKLLLCLDNNIDRCWILKINDKVQLIYQILAQRCRLINKRASKIIVDQINAQSPLYCPQEQKVQANYIKFKDLQKSNNQYNGPQYLQKQQNSGPQAISKQLTTSMLLIQASKSLSTGLVKAGELLSKGLEIFGSFLAKKVEPSENIVLSEQTKNLIDKSAKGTKQILEFATDKFTYVFRMGKNEANKLLEKAQNSEKGKEMIGQGNYKEYKKKLLTGLHIIGNIYGGITEGISQAGNGLVKGSTQVVGAKYGPQAKELSYQMMEGGRNIYRIANIPENVVINEIKSSSQKSEDKKFNPTQAVIKKL